ncbi:MULTISPECIES: sigma-54-dependent Fis family transcriptional regulator [unclassified Vibrio]|uniref:Sigma-54 interaction domain-containing protein n=1 Tax=Vibrio sp. HB236076 TaxID=3232307 RepID=A0AB39HDJ2_9VIBR|nr:sigma-54 dependent transcriptional regulator [Vibrio sp. HB161653]MDP5255122.1 sigma-54 dependent transcriptional regulator [Vibrio sp. HB161653]
MKLPSLFIDIQDPKLSAQVQKLAVVGQFSLQHRQQNENWLDSVVRLQPNVVVAEITTFNQKQYENLKGTLSIQNCELIIISSGDPNVYLEKLLTQGAIFHYRHPVSLNALSENLEDAYVYYSEVEAQGETIVHSSLDQYGMLVGSSKPMRDLYRIIRRVAKTDTNILIVGESGSGKELVAQTLHLASHRHQQPFIAINCGAIAPDLIDSELFGHQKGAFTGANRQHEGVFEQAKGGTLFLDEITEMALEHQVKLLRVLESGEYRPVGSQEIRYADTRIIAASNRNPQTAIDEQFLREDLYFRLTQFPISVPPLRERGQDIVGLAKHFIAHRNAGEQTIKSILPSAIEKIEQHNWPGNVRELKHCIERAWILADDVIGDEHLIFDTPPLETGATDTPTVPLGMPLEEVEKAVIIKTLEEKEGNKTEAAQDLGISIKTLYNKLDKYNQE